MKTEDKYSRLVWVIVVLAALNVSTLATIIYHYYQTVTAVTSTLSDQKQLQADSGKSSGRYFRDQLNLSSDQMEKFRVINLAFRPNSRNITINLEEKRKQMMLEMSASKSDTSKLIALSDSIGYLHSDLKKITFRYYLDIKNMCDQQQQQKLQQIFDQMFSTDSSAGRQGKGGPGGRQHGKQFRN